MYKVSKSIIVQYYDISIRVIVKLSPGPSWHLHFNYPQ